MTQKRKSPEVQPEAVVPDVDQRLPPHLLIPISKVVASQWAQIEMAKVNEIARLLWLPEGLDETEKHARIIRAVDLFESVKPAEGIEAMLAVQMVGTHHAAMECLRRAMLQGQTFEARDAALKHAQRLMTLYGQQMAALDKHRGKGQQKITVERVQVAAGGQAIVGNVQAAPSLPPGPSGQPHALEAPREDTVPPPARSRAKGRR